MKATFEAEIYKIGINPAVDVPAKITDRMKPVKGYIPVKGKINKHPFLQTLVPIKASPYRLYVNGPMMKGASVVVGDTAKFTIEQNFESREKEYPMLKQLQAALKKSKLAEAYKALTPSRQKEIQKYLNNLKSEEALERNIERVMKSLREKKQFMRK